MRIRAICLWAALCLVVVRLHAQDPVVSGLFQYANPQNPVYKGFTKHSTYVPLSDGVKLAVDYFIPQNKNQETGPLPAVVFYTPYNRSYLFPHMNPVLKLASASIGFGWGPVFDLAKIENVSSVLLENGYALVYADMRGTGASFGTQMPLSPQLGADGKELIDWVAAQPWCNGDVGMRGLSYLGWGQYATASHQPEALRCIMPEVIGFDAYTDANRPGGIAATRWLKGYSRILSNNNWNVFDFKNFNFPATPVVDENGNGRIADEWPKIDSSRLAQWKNGDFSVGFAQANSPYIQATLEHLDNVLVADMLDSAYRFYNSPAPAPYQQYSYQHVGAGNFLPGVAASGIPVYHLGGWFDGFTRGSVKLHATLAATNPARLTMTPRFHLGLPKSYQKAFDYGPKLDDQMQMETLRFFDRYLKGIPNGLDKEPPVSLFVMNKGWRTAAAWPVPEQQIQTWYIGANRFLTPDQPASGADTWMVDWTHTSNYGEKRTNRWLMFRGGPESPMDRTAADGRTLYFDTEPVKDGLEIVGHPVVNLFFSANQPTADIYVYLCDVDESGKSLYITEGQLRANYHREVNPQLQVAHDMKVLPELPWHGYRSEDFDPQPFEGGKVVEMRFDLLPTAWYLKPGHRLRIAVAGADLGNFELPSICPDGKRASCPETLLTLHRGGVYPSRLELPVIPASSK